MDKDLEIDVDAPLAVAFNFHKKRKLQSHPKTKKLQKPSVNKEVSDNHDVVEPPSMNNGLEWQDSSPFVISHEVVSTEGAPGINVSFFDYSTENHLKAVHTMFKLCGDPDTPNFSQAEIQRLSSSITFLKEWRDFNYKPKTIRFACQNESLNGNDVIGEISLPQFSAVSVPKDLHNKQSMSFQPSEDFVLYAGGSVWALDWCPRANQHSGSGLKMEFVAVAAHPPGSSYHKIGSALTGRGVIQIWCMLDIAMDENTSSQVQKKQKSYYKKHQTDNSNSVTPKRPRGRPKKDRTNDTSDNIKSGSQVGTIPFGCVGSEHVAVTDARNDPALTSRLTESKLLSNPLKLERLKGKARIGERGHGHNLEQDGKRDLTYLHAETCTSYDPSSIRSGGNVNSITCRDVNTVSNCSPIDDVPLPRMMLCLAHNGKVVWDLKWRPSNSHDKVRLGYLAVVLGSGVIEVWDVPFPYAVEVIYSSSPQLECTDPRFIKLEPVFRCSKLTCGDKQSIPLTVEWSTSSPHDMVVAGCHDGVVALWKFSAAVSCKETKPLLRFNADKVPIRTLAWSPAESNCEGSNVIVTGGNKGLKFWDIRDPFHPLWDFNAVQMNILSLDWLPDPRCVVVSSDDGTLRVLSLMKAANDGPVTGKPFTGTPQQGFSSYFCSASAIWDVHVSRKTGMVAYCGFDGNALHFQLTTRAVEKDPSRNRAPHFLCGSLTIEDSKLTLVTPRNDIPFPMKKSLNEWADVPRTKRGFLAVSNQKKRAKVVMGKSKILDEPPLALCYGNDLGDESDTDPLIPQNTKQAHKSSTKRTSKANERGLICSNENLETSQNEADQDQEHVVDEIDSFPPKSIAIHRVRWNMNKGSERWLCYGGAAGIIRFQKVDIPIS